MNAYAIEGYICYIMISYSIFFFCLVQSSFANFEDSYSENLDNYNLYSDEFLDPDESDIEKRDNHFMRFGRNSRDYKNKEYIYDEIEEPSVHVKRSGNHHVRFGRSGSNSFMRYGRDPSKIRNKSTFLRLGRNFQDQDEKIRAKRSTPPENLPVAKSPERIHRGIYMRLGRSPSFMRYGRDPDQALDFPDPSSLVGKNRAFLDQISPVYENDLKENHLLTLILAKLLSRRQELLAKPIEDSV